MEQGHDMPDSIIRWNFISTKLGLESGTGLDIGELDERDGTELHFQWTSSLCGRGWTLVIIQSWE